MISATDRARAVRTSFEQVEVSHRAFGVADAKGRELGYRVIINRVRFDAAPADARFPYLIAAERVGVDTFVVEPHALRNGASYGAIPVKAHKVCFSLEEARIAAAAMFAAAAKRATKQVAL